MGSREALRCLVGLALLRRVLRRLCGGFWGRVLRRALRREPAMGFTVLKGGSEKGSQNAILEGGFQKAPRPPPRRVRLLRYAPYQCVENLEGPTRKPQHASIFSTHSDMQAVPAFHCFRMLKGNSSTRAFLNAPTRCLPMLKEASNISSTR